MVYQGNAAGDIGTLLRLIQEEKSVNPITAPAAETGSPIREMVQGPILSPEAPESARQVSLKPEGSGPNQMPVFQPVGGTSGGIVQAGLTPGIIGPAVPGRSAQANYDPGGGPLSQGGGGSSNTGTAPSAPYVGTRVGLTPPIRGDKPLAGGSVLGAQASKLDLQKAINSGGLTMPSRGYQQIVSPKITPAPEQKNKTINSWFKSVFG